MAGARQIRDEIMKMTIVVNSDPAQKAIYDLGKKNQDLKDRNKELDQSMKETSKTLGKKSEEYKKLTDEMNRNKAAITANEREMERLRGEMDISQMTMQQLRKEAALLRANLSNMVPGSEPARLMQEQLDRVNARMAEVRNGANQTSNSFRNLADRFNHYQGIVLAVGAVLVGFGVTVQNIIDRNNKMADAMSGVEKTTGLAKKEVQELLKTFSEFDTRTSRMDLLKIAEIGGRLGVAQNEIGDFTREVDKMYVALGDSFQGGVEQVATDLGKIKTLFSETRDLDMATAFNQIGSAMNELGANGAASEANIANFTLRVGALPENLKPSIAETLALGAAFEESGIDAERAGTAYSSFVRMAAKESDKFAKVMNMTKKEVADLINQDPMEFFLKFAEGAKGMDTTEMAKMLDYLKLNDQYVISILGSASENTDRFRKSIDLSNKSLKEATSLQEEFNKVNNNAAAIWEKTQKKISSLLTSQGVAQFISNLVESFGMFIGAIEDSEGKVTAFREALFTLLKLSVIAGTAMVSYNVAIGTYNGLMATAASRIMGLTVIEKARGAYLSIATALQNLYNLAVGTAQKYTASLMMAVAAKTGAETLNTRATNLQTAAQQRLNAVTRAHPLGLIIAVIMAAVAAYQLYKSEIIKTVDAQNRLNKVLDEGAKNAADEVTSLDLLYRAATDVTKSINERNDAVKKLQEQYPSYFANIDKEVIKNGKARDSYLELRDAIISSARADAAREELKKQQATRIKRDAELQREIDKETGTRNNLKASGKDKNLRMDGGDGKSFAVTITAEDQLNASRKRLNNLKETKENFRKADEAEDKMWIDAINADEKRSAKYRSDKNKIEEENTAASSYTTTGLDDKEKKKKNAEAEARRKAREQEAYEKMITDWKAKGETSAQMARQIQLDIEDAKIEAMEEGYDKQIDALELQEMRKMAEIDKKKIGQSEFDRLDAAIKKAKDQDKALFTALRASWIKNNNDLEELKLNEQAVFENKRQALKYKSEKEFLDQQEQDHKKQLGQLQRQMNEEMASYQTLADLKEGLRGRMDEEERRKIRTWAQGKEALTKVYLKRELDIQVAHLEAMVKLYEGIDLGMLTPEQRKEVMAFIDEAGNKIAEFKAKAAGEEQKEKPGPTLGRKAPTDILGLSTDDWQTMFTNIQTGADMLGTVQAAVGALHNAFGAYYQFVEANEKRQLQQVEAATNRKKQALKKQLLEGYINQETYKQLTIKADQDLEKKKHEIAVKQAKREKQMAIASTLINTAQAIMGIWAQFPKFDFGATAAIMSGVVGALGAVQVATIMSQPLPTAEGYEEGFGMEYPIARAQDGKRFNVRRRRLTSGLVDSPTHFIAGENQKVEMVIDNPTWTRFPPHLQSAIHTGIARAKGFESGYYPEETVSKSGDNDEVMKAVMAMLGKNIEVLGEMQQYGVKAVIEKNARNGMLANEMIQEAVQLKNKNKH